MHPESYRTMGGILASLESHLGGDVACLDVGARDVNGSYRPIVEELGWDYTGLDVTAGKNVDVVADEPYGYPFADGAFDVVISGSTMEHVAAFWRWVPELARVLRPGGFLAIYTHWQFPLHRYPVDCWRVLPDGMDFLLKDCGLVGVKSLMIDERDIVGHGWKAPGPDGALPLPLWDGGID